MIDPRHKELVSFTNAAVRRPRPVPDGRFERGYVTPDGRPIPWPEGEDVGTYEDSQSMVHSKIGSKKTYVPTQFSFEPACKSDPLSSLVNYIVVAAGILEASDNTHTHIPNNPPCDCWSRRESATFCLTAWGPKQKWFWTRSFAAESK